MQHQRRMAISAGLLSLTLLAAACGSDTSDPAVTDAVAAEEAMTDDAMGDDEAMTDDDAMADEESMTEDEAMSDDEAMADESMSDDDAMTDDSMDDDAMEDESMDDSAGVDVALSFDGLEPLGDGFVYEGWAIVDGAPVSTGRFSLEADGRQLFHSGSELAPGDEADTFVLTIEPAEGDDPAPADAHVLAGDFADGAAELSIAHPAALGNDFADAAGEFVLATPTSAATDDELSGIWFIRLAPTRAGLDLPTLPDGWVYEGWAVIDGQPITTGRFTDPAAADDFAGFSGSDGSGPPFPGEDLIQNAPAGLAFPLDLTGQTVVVSIEPADDDSPAPFAFKPLAAVVPDGIGDHQAIELGAGPGFPTGQAIIG